MAHTPFKARFELLEEAGQVSQRAIDATLQVIGAIERRFGRRLDEDNAAMFVTHMVIAFERLIRREELNEVPPEVLDEVVQHPDTQQFVSEVVRETLAPYDVRLPDAEIAYLALHLVALQQVDDLRDE
jgi:transcriptional regulatory protein LevR